MGLVVPYLNYSTLSEPCDEHNEHIETHESHETQVNANVSLPPSLDPFDEEDWDLSLASSLPTEFDLRPDLTPTVLIIESDSDLFSHLRKLPELVVLRRDYYEPLKDTVLHSMGR